MMPHRTGAERLMKELLGELLTRSGALAVQLISRAGNTVAQAGEASFLNRETLAILMAGLFSGSTKVARMVGEQRFGSVIQLGQCRSLHLCRVNDDLLLVVLFEDSRRVGRVRYEAGRAGTELAALFQAQREDDAERSGMKVSLFREAALRRIDELLVKG